MLVTTSWPQSVALIGPGAVGTVIASRLLARGITPTLCGRTTFSSLEVEHAARPPWRRAGLAVCTEPATVEAHELVLLCTKAHQQVGVGAWLAALIGPRSVVVVLQNGVEQQARVRELLGLGADTSLPCQVLPAVVDLPAVRRGAGCALLRRDGSVLLPTTATAQRVVGLFEGDAIVRWALAEDFPTQQWRKLCVNVISGAIPALTDQPGGIFRRLAIQALARDVVRECIAVGRAEGAALADALADEIVAGFAAGPVDAINSMLQDRRAGRPLEVDARNGAVARIGARHGIATPLNGALAALASAVNGAYDPLATAEEATRR